MPDPSSALPYKDSKPVGASDFYFAIHATFRFLWKRFGEEGLRKYWHDLGSNYFAPVSQRWKNGGMAAVAAHWRAFFDAEPDAEVAVMEDNDEVVLEIKVCPALKRLKERGDVMPCFCQHCYFINEAIAKPAGMVARVSGGNGSCTQRFLRAGAQVPDQDMTQIKEVTC